MATTQESSPIPAAGARRRDRPVAWQGYVWALGSVMVVALIATPLAGRLDLANIVMLHMLPVVAIAFRFGRGPTVTAAVVNVAAFDFFFVPPRFSFAVTDTQYLLTFTVMLLTGLVIAHLATRLKREASEASLRAQQSRDLYEMARLLSGALADEQITEAATQFFSRSFGARVLLMVRDRSGNLTAAHEADPMPLAGLDMVLAQRAFEMDSAGEAITAGTLHYLPLKAPMRTRGVLIVAPSEAAAFDGAGQRQQLETVAVLIAIALERVHFVTVAREATVQMEGERLRSGLLAALSHDLRTPLTAILGSAESLKLGLHGLTVDQAAMIEAIRDQARHTNELVENILDMARLESGAVRLRKEWQSLEEIIGSALKARAPSLLTHPVSVVLPADMPLVECDATLIERVFVNLIENAAKYTPPGSAIRISAAIEANHLRIDVVDHGAGVARGQESAIFGKFVRANATADVPGLGLGLAICRTVVEAHAGRIWVENLPAGGADFAFTLPRGNPPPAELDSPESL